MYRQRMLHGVVVSIAALFMPSLFHLARITLLAGVQMMMRIALLGVLAFAITAGLGAFLQQQSSGSDFSEFYANFKTAIANHDKQQLQRMMASDFEFWRATNVAPANVFRALDQNNGQQWKNLQLAVLRGTPVVQNFGDHPARVLWCTPTQVIYNCYVVFEKDNSGRWRWRRFVTPQK
jgi:hypothetical protein